MSASAPQPTPDKDPTGADAPAKTSKRRRNKKPWSNKKFLAVWIPVVAIIAVVAIGANVAIGYWRTAIESYMGTGTYSIDNTDDGDKLDTQYYASEHSSIDEAKAATSKVVDSIGDEGMVLLKNSGALPMNAGKVTLLGRGAADPIYGGSGSGGADTSTAVDFKTSLETAGFTVNDTMYTQLDEYAKANPASEGGRTNIVMDEPDKSTYKIGEMPVDQYSQASRDSFAQFHDAAVVVIGRGGGEGGDLATDMTEWDDAASDGEHQLELNSDEKETLALAEQNFDTVVVVINTSTSMELGTLEDDPEVDAILHVGSPGVNGLSALGRILSGEVNPSGRTTDIFSADFTADPTFKNFGSHAYSNIDGAHFVDYEEGIYSGYRFYETAAVEGFLDYEQAVVYPFGYGLSYTTFEHSVASQRMEGPDGQITVEVSVTIGRPLHSVRSLCESSGSISWVQWRP